MEAIATFGLLADHVQNAVDQLRPFRVVPLCPVVPRASAKTRAKEFTMTVPEETKPTRKPEMKNNSSGQNAYKKINDNYSQNTITKLTMTKASTEETRTPMSPLWQK